jgi:hypothetical protein
MAVVDDEVFDHRAGRAVERAGTQCGEDRFLRAFACPHPRPGKSAVELSVMRVVGCDRKPGPAVQFESFVPVHGR